MATSVVVNLPVSDLDRSKAFYEALGATIVPEFTDENAACVRWDENVFFMILRNDYFATFTDRPIVTPEARIQVMTASAATRRSTSHRRAISCSRTAAARRRGGRPASDEKTPRGSAGGGRIRGAPVCGGYACAFCTRPTSPRNASRYDTRNSRVPSFVTSWFSSMRPGVTWMKPSG